MLWLQWLPHRRTSELDYETEEQQVEAIKKWWSENGNSVILGVAIGGAAILGWQFWNKHQVSKARQASDGYSETIAAMSSEADAVSLASKVKDEHGGTLYAAMAALAAAREHVSNGAIDKAETELAWAVKNSPLDEVSMIARVRLARVQASLGEHDKAMKTLPKKPPEAFTALVEEVRGDVYAATGEHDKARASYTAALESTTPGGDRNALTMKLNDLATADAGDAS